METWLNQHFFNPSFVLPAGAALLAAPVIIHLINRMRYRRVRFAAMEFLLKSQQRNRRRLLLEQLLLLLLRMAAVAGIVILIGRLILDPNQMSVFRGAKAHHVVLLDDSGSMRDRWGETSAFEQGLDVVRKLVAEGSRRPDTQTLTLILLSNPEQPIFLERDVDEAFVTELETRLERLQPTHRALDLSTGVDAAAKLFAEGKGGVRHLHIVSDYRLADWSTQSAAATALQRLDEADVAVTLVRTVAELHRNLAI
ncbi:MAG: BatA domain-containing protein, partial [Planctomycetaceae bacterium]